MSMQGRAQFTPGPWVAQYNNEGLTIFGGYNVTVAYVDYDEEEQRPVDANANLIAAAPAMYEALKLAMEFLEDNTKNYNPDTRRREFDENTVGAPAYLAAKAALAQAEGRQA